MLLKKRMQVYYLIPVMEPSYIFPHHTRLRHTWSDNGTRCHQRDVLIAQELFQQLPHGRRFYIKTTNGLRFPDLLFDVGVGCLKLWKSCMFTSMPLLAFIQAQAFPLYAPDPAGSAHQTC